MFIRAPFIFQAALCLCGCLLWLPAARLSAQSPETKTQSAAPTDGNPASEGPAPSDDGNSNESADRSAAGQTAVGEGKPRAAVVLTAAQRQQVDQWIVALSSEKFAAREEAVAGLIEFGEPVIPHLVAAADTHDPEVRLRIRILLSRLSDNDFESAVTAFLSGASDDLEGWEYARKVIGDGKAARELFVEAARQHRDLMQDLNGGAGARMIAANKAADLIVRRMMLEFIPPERGDGVALLLTCADRSAPIPPGVERVIVRILNSHATNQTLADAMLAPVYRKLMGFWMQRASATYQPQAMYFALQHNVPDAVELARDVVAEFVAAGTDLTGTGTVDPKYSEALEQALLVVAKFGDANDVPRLQPLTLDARRMPIGSDQPEDADDVIRVHVRDIAVAVSIRLMGGDLREAGYLNPREHSAVVFFTASLGFPGDGEDLRSKPAKYLADLIAKP